MRRRLLSARKAMALVAGILLAWSVAADLQVRKSALAGAWYPAESRELGAYVDGLLDATRVEPAQDLIRALIAPHAGYVYSGATAAQVFAMVRGRKYRRVMVLAPSHRSGFYGLSVADVDAYETPLGRIQLDAQAITGLRDSRLIVSDPTAHTREHAIEIELPLLQRTLAPDWTLIPVLVGQLEGDDYRAAAELLRPLADADTLVVVSSDFTHFGPRFGFLPFPPDAKAEGRIRALDDGAIERILARDGPGLLRYQARTGITICGYRPLALLLHMLPAEARVERVAYSTSGDLTGDYGSSVSYVAMVVKSPTPFDAEDIGSGVQQGVILRKGDRRGLYLPEVTEREGWTREGTLSSLARKAGLPADAWRNGATLEVFSCAKYAEAPSAERASLPSTVRCPGFA